VIRSVLKLSNILTHTCCQTYNVLEILYIEIITCCSRPLFVGHSWQLDGLSGWQRGGFMLSADEEWVRRLFLFVSIVYCVYNSPCSTIMLYYAEFHRRPIIISAHPTRVTAVFNTRDRFRMSSLPYPPYSHLLLHTLGFT